MTYEYDSYSYYGYYSLVLSDYCSQIGLKLEFDGTNETHSHLQ